MKTCKHPTCDGPCRRITMKAKPKKKKEKTVAQLSKMAEKVFNDYIRQRDSQDGYFTCISSGKVHPIDEMNAGHYVPVKNSSFLRFHEWNVNGESAYSNCFDGFHLVGYRKNLIEKIGLDAVNWLDAHSRKKKKFTRSELIEIIEKYGSKGKERTEDQRA
jgi:hypothetical protein